jgi:signal transduction histidine kinase
LAAAHQLKDQFLSLASHELKTPIAAIKGYAQLTQRRLEKILQTAPATSAAQESLTKITAQSDRLTALVDDLLDVSRIQAGMLELRLAQCDLAALCQQAVEEQHTSTERLIDLALPTGPMLLLADSERIGQVLQNLIGNALKYSDAQARVQVTLTCQNGQAEVRVYDQGVGIPSDEVPRIFERFFRARTAREGPQRGLGLGLAICKEVIERHQGRIWAESVEGKGSMVAFALPLAGETTGDVQGETDRAGG